MKLHNVRRETYIKEGGLRQIAVDSGFTHCVCVVEESFYVVVEEWQS